jgi:hypothetical protein
VTRLVNELMWPIRSRMLVAIAPNEYDYEGNYFRRGVRIFKDFSAAGYAARPSLAATMLSQPCQEAPKRYGTGSV